MRAYIPLTVKKFCFENIQERNVGKEKSVAFRFSLFSMWKNFSRKKENLNCFLSLHNLKFKKERKNASYFGWLGDNSVKKRERKKRKRGRKKEKKERNGKVKSAKRKHIFNFYEYLLLLSPSSFLSSSLSLISCARCHSRFLFVLRVCVSFKNCASEVQKSSITLFWVINGVNNRLIRQKSIFFLYENWFLIKF